QRVQGNYREAEALLRQALDIYQQQLGQRHPDVATSLNNLAMLHHFQGRHGEAKRLLTQALNMRREQLGDRHPLVAVSLGNLAVPYQAEGDIEAAIAHLQDSLTIQEWHLNLNLATLTDAQRQAYAATIAKTVDLTLSLHLQTAPHHAEAAELALTTLLRRKGRILDASISSQQVLRQNLTSEDQATLDQLNIVQQDIAALVFDSGSTMAPAAYQARLAELEANATQLETTLARRHALFQTPSEPVDLAAVQAQIPANGVLIEYVRYVPFDPNNLTAPWGEARYAAYLLFPDGRIEAVDLGAAAAIDTAVSAFIRNLRTSSELVPGSEGEDAIANPLKPLIFDPIAPYLADREHLLISTDSQLNRIPFEALQTEGKDDYLVERYQISYLTSGRDLLKFATSAPSTAPALIVANPTYDADGPVVQTASSHHSRSLDLSQMQVSQLPGTAAEAEAIAALLPDATMLTEDQATETALKTVRAPRILHIATHGFFLENGASLDPATRGLGIEWTEAPAGGSTRSGATVENPLLRSGLALAGFNARSSGDEDGVLTALEAAHLNLVGTQLVVLSACETGLGDIANGEGVYGLRRSLAIAGAETQLMSLWRVSDEGTQALMTRYYEHLMNGRGRSEALRATQLEMIAAEGQYSHPYYWAPFILAGNWRSLQ
ncbi:MAG: CHAT domain-containing protein, partial [Cyanobacteria bacterium J06626_23]